MATRWACTFKTTAGRMVKQMKELKKLIDNLGAKAQQVADLKLACVVDDVDLLTVALCVSNLTEVARTLSASKEGETSYIAAHKALDIGWNPSIRGALVETGYFAEGLRGLLELAEHSSITGSRLMPAFEEAVSIHKELHIPKKLVCKLKNYINEKLELDGFAISNPDDDGKVYVKTARWVEEKTR